MNKIFLMAAIAAALTGCAGISFEKTDWSGINPADLTNLQAGKIALPKADVLEAAAGVLKAEGWELENVGEGENVTTVRKHGVTMYGSCDYAVTVAVNETEGVSNLTWSMISYVTQFITNVDPVQQAGADRRNAKVYEKLIEKGKITRQASPAAAAPEAGESAAPVKENAELPQPPKEEDVE